MPSLSKMGAVAKLIFHLPLGSESNSSVAFSLPRKDRPSSQSCFPERLLHGAVEHLIASSPYAPMFEKTSVPLLQEGCIKFLCDIRCSPYNRPNVSFIEGSTELNVLAAALTGTCPRGELLS